jgi:hypothetical protein
LRITNAALPPFRMSILVGTVSCSVNGLSAGLDTGSGQLALVLGAVAAAMPGMPGIEAIAAPAPDPAAGPESRAEATVTAATALPATGTIHRALREDVARGDPSSLFADSFTCDAPQIDVWLPVARQESRSRRMANIAGETRGILGWSWSRHLTTGAWEDSANARVVSQNRTFGCSSEIIRMCLTIVAQPRDKLMTVG